MVQMEKLVNHCDMELMKMAMLRHEETFRQQVHELHRLYRVQKQLMMTSGGAPSRPSTEIISSRRRCQVRRGCHRQPRHALDLRLPADDYILVVGAGNNATPPPQRQEDGLELTLAVGAGGRRKRRDDEGAGTPVGSDCSSGGGLTSSSSSITDTTSGSPAAPSRLQEGAAAAATLQQPPWLVQCLRLKMA